MKAIFTFFLYGFIACPLWILSWLLAFFAFQASFGLSFLWATGIVVIAMGSLIWRRKHNLLKRHQITNKDYRYIQSHLKEAHNKMKRLNKTLLGVRSFRAAKQIGKLQQMVSRIYRIVKKEPKRFFVAERFFFYYLDSIVELSERYTFLTRQNVKEPDVRESLAETERTLAELSNSIEAELRTILSDDIDELNIELDVAKHSIDREKKAFPKGRS